MPFLDFRKIFFAPGFSTVPENVTYILKTSSRLLLSSFASKVIVRISHSKIMMYFQHQKLAQMRLFSLEMQVSLCGRTRTAPLSLR